MSKSAVRNENRPHPRRTDANGSRVGGRQGSLPMPVLGGGYQDIHHPRETPVKAAAADPRIAELRAVGIPRIWITAAEAIGFEPFMRLWDVFMQAGHVDDRCRVVVPNMARYLRFQRNQLIRRLLEDGHASPQICEIVEAVTGEKISESHVRRAAGAG